MTREEKLVEALQWCSGSSDFQPGGVARRGWVKLCAPLLRKRVTRATNKRSRATVAAGMR